MSTPFNTKGGSQGDAWKIVALGGGTGASEIVYNQATQKLILSCLGKSHVTMVRVAPPGPGSQDPQYNVLGHFQFSSSFHGNLLNPHPIAPYTSTRSIATVIHDSTHNGDTALVAIGLFQYLEGTDWRYLFVFDCSNQNQRYLFPVDKNLGPEIDVGIAMIYDSAVETYNELLLANFSKVQCYEMSNGASFSANNEPGDYLAAPVFSLDATSGAATDKVIVYAARHKAGEDWDNEHDTVFAYSYNEEERLHYIGTVTGIDTTAEIDDIVFNPEGSRAYLFGRNKIQVVDVNTHHFISNIAENIDGEIRAGCVSKTKDLLYVVVAGGTKIAVFDTNTEQQVAEFKMPEGMDTESVTVDERELVYAPYDDWLIIFDNRDHR
ncbi:YncE family protein [Paludibacterium purpuratum]|uniref:Uncharacterized protein n=1 Tax=Paludibacterium purpuratum TaxID=1144873 RepID=A0A4R7B2D3_9NEIS|nr:hypothetical protein [Paludibacterium purpuratum]TDR73918.1 hypothetical protein DFP86_112122 [Paludibacterium purpuratum]